MTYTYIHTHVYRYIYIYIHIIDIHIRVYIYIYIYRERERKRERDRELLLVYYVVAVYFALSCLQTCSPSAAAQVVDQDVARAGALLVETYGRVV